MKGIILFLCILLISACDMFEEKYSCTLGGDTTPVSVKIVGNVMTFESENLNYCRTEGNKKSYSIDCSSEDITPYFFDTITKTLSMYGVNYKCTTPK